MKPVTTTVLASICVLLAIVITAVENKATSRGERRALLRFEASALESIRVQYRGEATLLRRLEGGAWVFAEPHQDRINPNAMRALLDELNYLTVLDRLPDEEATSLGEMGLTDDAAVKIAVTSRESNGDRRLQEVELGGPTDREMTRFARDERGKIVVVSGDPSDALTRPYETLRETNLLTAPAGQLVQIAVQIPAGGFVLKRDLQPRPEPWQIVEPVEARADAEKVDDLLAALLGLQISGVVSEEGGSQDVPDPLPQGTVLVRLGLFGREKPVTLFLSEKEREDRFTPREVVARISDRPPEFLLQSDIVRALPRAADDLRDRRLDTVPERALDFIALISRTDDPEVILKPERSARGVQWKVKIGSRFVDANYSRIQRLLERVNSPVVLDFPEPGPLSDFGLDPAHMRVGFHYLLPGRPLPDGSIGPEEKFSKVLQLGFRQGESLRLFANFLGEPEIFELDPSFTNVLPTHPVKWRSVNVLTFNPYHVTSIERNLPGRERILLEYDRIRDDWSATRAGVDLSANVNLPSVNALRDRLASLRAVGWTLQAGPAFAALADPSAVFEIVTRELDRATNEPRNFSRTLSLAPSAAEGIYYGRLDDNPDVFFIDSEQYEALVRPVTDSLIRTSP